MTDINYELKTRIAAFETEMALAEIEEIKGGAGSGNWGHAGRPGQKGGSMSQGQAMSRTTGGDAGRRQIAKKYADSNSSQFYNDLNSPKTPLDKKYAMVEAKMKGKFADWEPARTAGEIPVVDAWSMTPQILSQGKLTLFEENNGIGWGPVTRGDDGKFYTGTMGQVREIKPLLDPNKIIQNLGERSVKQLGAFNTQGANGLDLMDVPGVVQKGKAGVKITKTGADSFNKLVTERLVRQTSLIGPSGQGRYKLTDLGKQVLKK